MIGTTSFLTPFQKGRIHRPPPAEPSIVIEHLEEGFGLLDRRMYCSLLRPTAKAPLRKTEGAAGFDLFYDGEEIDFAPGDQKILSTGVSLEIMGGYYGQIAPRSGLAVEYGIVVLGGIIDSDYRGEVKVILKNTGKKLWLVRRGDRIAQLLILPCYQGDLTLVASLSETDRGAGGFGSTGK
jgi:dUTP pyrophosphatase